METRKLQTGKEVLNYEHSHKMTIDSHCPDKWRFVDLETGDIWRWDVERHCFIRANDIVDIIGSMRVT